MQPISLLAPNTRRVQHLHLRLSHEDSRERARIAIEDGLATAEFGDCNRLILVRRLVLPKLRTDLTGPGAARAIEASFRELLPDAVHASDPVAQAAPVVWFVDQLEALLEAISLRVEGRPLDAWFWRKALVHSPLPQEPPSISSLLSAIVAFDQAAPLLRHGAVQALAQRWRSWTPAAFERFVAALVQTREIDLVDWAWTDADDLIEGTVTRAVAAVTHATPRVVVAARKGLSVARWVARWELLAAGAMSVDAPIAGQNVLAAAVVDRVLSLPETPRRLRLVPASHAQASHNSAPEAVELSRGRTEAPNVQVPVTCTQQDVGHSVRRAEELLALPPWLVGGSASSHAGFFMLLNVWNLLGFDEWIATQASDLRRPICDDWLDRWSQRLHIPPDDVQRLAWIPREEVMPARASLAQWMSHTRRWLRTQARIGPASLVLRTGFVSITRTHVDVVFALNQVDIRVRRAGLDRDPGWVPWLGRIVAFHYVAGAPGETTP
jgi:hypothetical protein